MSSTAACDGMYRASQIFIRENYETVVVPFEWFRIMRDEVSRLRGLLHQGMVIHLLSDPTWDQSQQIETVPHAACSVCVVVSIVL